MPLLNTINMSYRFFDVAGLGRATPMPQGQVDLVRDVRIEEGTLMYDLYVLGSESVSNKFPGVKRVSSELDVAIQYLVKAVEQAGADSIEDFVEMHEGEGVEVVLK